MYSMKPLRSYLALVLAVLFFGLSFNAYACLVPVYAAADTMNGRDCSSPREEPARQFCDAFKTLALQSPAEIQPGVDCQAFCPEDTASLSFLVSIHARNILSYDHSADCPSQDLLLKTTVLRI